MNFLVQNITDFNLLEGTRIVAGNEGSCNRVLWINLMEILDSLDSLQEGELLVTTGYQLDDRNQFENIIIKLKEKGVCGMAIQPGYYINNIPKYILESAEKHGFPVLEIPSHLTFSHIMHVLLDNILTCQQDKEDSDLMSMKNKMNYIVNSNGENYLQQMLEKSKDYKIYFLWLSVNIDTSKENKEILFSSINYIKRYLLTVCEQVEMECSGKKVLFSLIFNEGYTFENMRLNLLKIMNDLCKTYKMKFLIGSSSIHNIEDLNNAISECVENVKILEENNVIKGICSSKDADLFKLFDKTHLNYHYSKEFAYNTLKSIINYDLSHDTNYLETVQVYLANECNITSTASQLFIHRHTLTNRINKIGEISEIDFNNYYSRMTYSLALFFNNCFLV